jgi:hypothetical protein
MIQLIYYFHMFNLTAAQCELVDRVSFGPPRNSAGIKELFGGSGPCRLSALPALFYTAGYGKAMTSFPLSDTFLGRLHNIPLSFLPHPGLFGPIGFVSETHLLLPRSLPTIFLISRYSVSCAAQGTRVTSSAFLLRCIASLRGDDREDYYWIAGFYC